MSSVVAIVPAHNEEAGIAATIESLLGQTVPPELIVVAVNNSTDNTADIARQYPVEVLDLGQIEGRKAGAMNAAWLEHSEEFDFVFTMDADTELAPNALEALLTDLEVGDLGASCARYWAKDGEGLVWRLQRLEYARFDDGRDLRDWKVQVASGAAVLYRQTALRMVVMRMGRDVPWDTNSLIEDYALTLDLKTVGWRVRASRHAHVHTDTPDTFQALWRQRLRWARGGIDEVRQRGWTHATKRDIGSYAMFAFSSLMRVLFIVFLILLFTGGGSYMFALIGLIPLGLMFAERMTSVAHLPGATWKDWSLAGTVLVEDAYGLALEACTAKAALNSYLGKRQPW